MRRRPLILAALAAGLAFAPTSYSVEPSKTAQVTDPESDANYLNDNAPIVLPVENPANNNPTPVGSDAAADILSIEWKTLKSGGTTKGFTVTMVLKAAPTGGGVLFRATSETADCSTLWFQYYTDDPKTTPQASLRHTCDGAAAVVPIAAKVVDNSIVWTYEFGAKDLPKVVKSGTEIIGLGGHSRDYVSNPSCVDVTRCTTNPVQIDVTNNVDGPYKVGS